MAVDRTFIKTLAQTNGLTIPEERLDIVLEQYQAFLENIERVDTVAVEKEVEPAIDYSLESTNAETGSGGERQ